MVEITLQNVVDTKKLADLLLKYLHPDSYVLLSGALGAGKTTFSKYLLEGLGVKQNVTSPTFVIVNQYHNPSGVAINHMDAYRLLNQNVDDELDMYLEMTVGAINIIEWPDPIINYLHSVSQIFKINFQFAPRLHSTRIIEFTAWKEGIEDEISNAFRQ